MNKVHYSSKSKVWETPQDLFDVLDQEFHFEVDVCAIPENAKCRLYYTPDQDGLLQPWGDKICWMNPPYGHGIARWVEKASRHKCVALLPARTDTRWFHDYILNKANIRFIKGRLKFSGHKWNAPFPCMIVIFNI